MSLSVQHEDWTINKTKKQNKAVKKRERKQECGEWVKVRKGWLEKGSLTDEQIEDVIQIYNRILLDHK